MKIATLGPAGSNHDLNTRRYIAFHGLNQTEIIYIEDFFAGLELMRTGDVDFMIQVCAHHHVAEVIEKYYVARKVIMSHFAQSKSEPP
ncbi:hypothetical protein L540_19385, partial [Bordetella pseudohinzii]